MPNQSVEQEEKKRPQTRTEQVERRAENKGRGETAHELNSGKLNEKHQEQKAAGEGNRKLTPKEAEVVASRGKLA